MGENPYQSLTSMPDINVCENVSLRQHTGFKTGGNADYIVTPCSQQAFIHTISVLKAHKQPYYILGNGSNVLALDEGYRGWVIKTDQAFREISFGQDGFAYGGAGVMLSQFCRHCAEKGLAGLEFAYGIPGTIGGAVYMNAGAYGGEIKDVVSSVTVIGQDGSILEYQKDEMAFGYRTSVIQTNGFVVAGASFQLCSDAPPAIMHRMDELMRRRREKQPIEYPSCGSTFKRPDGAFAAKLIDDCGLRGKTIGGAAVSEKHCGFVVNVGGATTADILELIDFIQQTVKDQTGFELEKEIRILK